MEHSLDIRKISAGGWGASKMEAKVNGRWTYFFEAEKNKPFNHKEPIGFGQKYRPPNHRKEAFIKYPQYSVHPKRGLYILSIQKQRAPFLFAQHKQTVEQNQMMDKTQNHPLLNPNREKNEPNPEKIKSKCTQKFEQVNILPPAWERRNLLDH